MEAKKLSVVLCVILLAIIPFCQNLEVDLTIEVNPGEAECFWQTLRSGTTAEMEYQVIDGGDLDIDFELFAPDGSLVEIDDHRQENFITVKAEMDGDYKFCFDNGFSHLSHKWVFFEITSNSVQEEDSEDDWKFDMEDIKDMVDMTYEDLKGVISRSKTNLDRSIQLQNLLKMHEARDRNVLEANFYRVNMFSAFQLFVMITVSLSQVVMIRSLFNDKKHVPGGLKQRT